MRFLQERGVDLADPDWGMQDDNIPFSTQHLPLRTLFAYYGEELVEYLASATLATVPEEEGELTLEEAENVAKYTHEMIEGVEFPCLGALAPDGSGTIVGPILEGEPVYVPPGEPAPAAVAAGGLSEEGAAEE